MASHDVKDDRERRAIYQACEIITDDYRLVIIAFNVLLDLFFVLVLVCPPCPLKSGRGRGNLLGLSDHY